MTFYTSAFFLLVIALSTDTFLAGLTYAAGRVRVPLLSKVLLSLLSGAVFTASVMAGSLITLLLPAFAVKILSFILLLLLALYKLYDVLPIYCNHVRHFSTNAFSAKVNRHDIHLLSAGEACLLAMALSVDSISAGLSFGNTTLAPAVILLSTTLIQYLALTLGLLLGKKLGKYHSYSFALLSVILLVLLAILRLF